MSAPEKNYEIHDKEMLAVVKALAEWRAELEGLKRKKRFEIVSDHRALEYFMITKKLNARQARWAEFLSRFYFLIKYRPGAFSAERNLQMEWRERWDAETYVRLVHAWATYRVIYFRY